MNEELQLKNFEYIKDLCEVQLKVRNCEIEGSEFDLESKITTCANLEMISLHQEDILLDILKGT